MKTSKPQNRSRFQILLSAVAVLTFCGLGACIVGGGEANNDGSVIKGAFCSSSDPCPSGQFCWNGLCALGCTSNDDCAADQYCDTEFDMLCHNRTVSTCPDTPCAEGQICKDGFCSTPPVPTQCTPRLDGMDGCDDYSLCLEEEDESTACYSFPACDQNRQCPVGMNGAVCNTGIIPNKAYMCLTGLCQTPDHCPTNWSCIRNATDTVGMCSDGQMGSLCLNNDNCQSGLDCMGAMPGSYGVCMTGMGF